MKSHLRVPASKSHTLRAILFGALAHGTSRVERFLPSPDTQAMIEAARAFGAEIKVEGDALEIRGFAGKPKPPQKIIDCGNSGIALRFLGALAALQPHSTAFTGDASLQRRPAKPLLDALRQLGVAATNDFAPFQIRGPITGNRATLDGEDSQPVSGLLIAGSFAPHPIELHVTNPGEKPWIDLTLHWLARLKIPFERDGYSYYRLKGRAEIDGFTYTVPGDASSAAFPLAAALLTHSELTLHNLDFQDCQGDLALIDVLEEMGARFIRGSSSLTALRTPELRGMRIDVNDFIDALPILAVIGCFATGRTELVNGKIARKKESDRIHAMATELKKMGAKIEETPDGLLIEKSELHGAELESYNDHRVAMALLVASRCASSPSTIRGTECIAKTYPNFLEELR